MQKVARTTIIDATVHEVFSYAANWQFWTDWFDGFTDCSPITKVGGPLLTIHLRGIVQRVVIVHRSGRSTLALGLKGRIE